MQNENEIEYDYKSNTPNWLILTIILVVLLAIVPLINLIYMGINNLSFGFKDEMTLAGLGQLGDFFGGHTAAFSTTLSLLAVLYFTHHQARQQDMFFSQQRNQDEIRSVRTFFLEGVSLITQWDLASPGSDQCLRLLDYYSRLALTSTDRELALILNTVITAQIRSNLQGKNGSFKKTNYPFACLALERIAELRKQDGLAMKRKTTHPVTN
jgi:hypothetical protein